MGCFASDIGAYLDGELDQPATARFEEHVAECSRCRDELNTHRRLLNTIQFVFDDRAQIELPDGFSRAIASGARADMSGLRKQPERLRAFRFTVYLLISALALLGWKAANSSVVEPAQATIQVSKTLLGIVWHTIAALWAGVDVILRAIARIFLSGAYLVLDQFSVLLFAVLIIGFIGVAIRSSRARSRPE